MPEDETRRGPTGIAASSYRTQLLSSDDVSRALRRMAHEIIERNHDVSGLAVVGLRRGGEEIARRLADLVAEVAGASPVFGLLDVSFYRDDIGRRPLATPASTEIDRDLTDVTVVLVDDVLFTGRTIRAAMNALGDWGRPRAIQLAVLVDRGHRELPIRPDFVGKNLPTSHDESVEASLGGVWLTKGAP